MKNIWQNIKSGSDIRGVASENSFGEPIELTNEVVEKIFLAFSCWIASKTKLKYRDITVAVGHDSRNSASRIKNVCINTLRSVGINVYDCAMVSTPAMFMATSVLECTAAVEITASHLPSHKNGFKFFVPEGGLSGEDISEILSLAENGVAPSPDTQGNVRFLVKLKDYYCEKLKNIIKEGINSLENYDKPLSGFKIVVDAGNGAGGFFANDILKPLGADVQGSVFLEPDGSFPNHIPNPEDANAMQSIINTTVNSEADLGIIFDTDVDRAAFVDSSGMAIDKNRLIALAATTIVEKSSNAIVVTDSITSDYLRDFIKNLGGSQFRYKRGYNNVINMAKQINKKGAFCPLAIETSGHAAFKENGFIDDGAYLACKIIIKMVNLAAENKTIKDELENLIEAKESKTFRVPINNDNPHQYAQNILKEFEQYVSRSKNVFYDKENIEGVRAYCENKHQQGWLNLRESLHEPQLVLYIESYVSGGLKNILSFVNSFLNSYDSVSKVSLD